MISCVTVSHVSNCRKASQRNQKIHSPIFNVQSPMSVYQKRLEEPAAASAYFRLRTLDIGFWTVSRLVIKS